MANKYLKVCRKCSKGHLHRKCDMYFSPITNVIAFNEHFECDNCKDKLTVQQFKNTYL